MSSIDFETRVLRILVVTSVFPRWPGDATPPFVRNACDDLAAAGCRITVLAPHSAGAARRECDGPLEVIRYPYLWPARMQALCYEGGMIVRLRERPARALQVPLLALAQWAALRTLLLRRPFDLIHAHSLLPQGMLAALANDLRIPLVTSSHGADVFLLQSRWAPLLRAAVSASDAVVANSTATRERLRALGAPAHKIFRIPATPNYPDPEAPSHRPPPDPVLLFAGRLIPEKGVDALLEAMPLIRRRFPSCTLRVAGAGVMEGQLQERARQLGLGDAVVFPGWLPPDRLRQEMRNATLLVAPSRMIEGQNLVVTEALSVGCPAATTPRGGVLDLVRDGETGFVIPAPEPEAIAATVGGCLASPGQLQAVGDNGFNHFQSHFSRASITASTISLYRDLIRRHR